MAAIEKLLTMGLAHGIDTTRMQFATASGGSSSPAVDQLTWEDVSRAVVTLPRAQRAALYLKCAPELATALELAQLTNDLALALIKHDDRRQTYTAEENASGHAFRRQALVVRTVLAEYMDPRTCRRCHGEGTQLDHVPGKGMVKGTCGRCEGKGWSPWSDNRRARACAVRRADWLPKNGPGYTLVLDACSNTYREAAKGFKRALFDEGTDYDELEQRLQAGV